MLRLLVALLVIDAADSRARKLRNHAGFIQLPNLSANNYHLFLSHSWDYGQDQMRIVKQRKCKLRALHALCTQMQNALSDIV